MELLLSWGANVEAEDNLGRTPLFAAVTAVSEDAPAPRGSTAIRLLRERGARLDVSWTKRVGRSCTTGRRTGA